MAIKHYVMGLFKNEEQAVSALRALKNSAWEVHRVHSPIPSQRLARVLALKTSRVGWFTLAGGIIGFLAGYGLAIFTALRWGLMVSGKPVVAYIPFVIVGFEFTVLFAIIGNFIGFLQQSRLPRFRNLDIYDPRCSADHYGVLSSCDPDGQDGLLALMINNGGEVKIFEKETL